MFDDFFIRALTAGLGLALVTGPLGCFVIWRRLSFFAGTLAHSALLGVTLAFSFDINIIKSKYIRYYKDILKCLYNLQSQMA